MLLGLFVLLLAQLLGEFVAAALGIDVPGPVLGLMFYFGYLLVRRPGAEAVEVRASEGLLKHLQLLFIPAGVGVVQYLGTLGENAVSISVGLAGSWLIALLVTSLTASLLLRFSARSQARGSRSGQVTK